MSEKPRLIVSRDQMPTMKELGWVVVGNYGGGHYVMEYRAALAAPTKEGT